MLWRSLLWFALIRNTKQLFNLPSDQVHLENKPVTLFKSQSLAKGCAVSLVAAGSTPPDCGVDFRYGGEGQPAWKHRPVQQCLPVLLPAYICQVAVPGWLFWAWHSRHRRAERRECPATPLPGMTLITSW